MTSNGPGCHIKERIDWTTLKKKKRKKIKHVYQVTVSTSTLLSKTRSPPVKGFTPERPRGSDARMSINMSPSAGEMCHNRARQQTERKHRVPYRSGEKRPSVWMTSSREAQGRWISAATRARCEEARFFRDATDPVVRSQDVEELVWGLPSKLLSAPLTSSPREKLLCFCSQTFQASLQSASFWGPPGGAAEFAARAANPAREMADGRKMIQWLWLPWSAGAKWRVLMNPCWRPLCGENIESHEGAVWWKDNKCGQISLAVTKFQNSGGTELESRRGFGQRVYLEKLIQISSRKSRARQLLN